MKIRSYRMILLWWDQRTANKKNPTSSGNCFKASTSDQMTFQVRYSTGSRSPTERLGPSSMSLSNIRFYCLPFYFETQACMVWTVARGQEYQMTWIPLEALEMGRWPYLLPPTYPSALALYLALASPISLANQVHPFAVPFSALLFFKLDYKKRGKISPVNGTVQLRAWGRLQLLTSLELCKRTKIVQPQLPCFLKSNESGTPPPNIQTDINPNHPKLPCNTH